MKPVKAYHSGRKAKKSGRLEDFTYSAEDCKIYLQQRGYGYQSQS